MNNQEYSIYIAQDNVDEIIEGFSTLFFDVKNKAIVGGHNFSLQTKNQAQPALGLSSIIIPKKNIKQVIKKSLELKNNLLIDGQEVSIKLGRNAEIVFIFSPF